MSATKTVLRKYSIKRYLNSMEEWDRLKALRELEEAWELDSLYTNRLINIPAARNLKISAERLLAATKILDATMAELMTPFLDTARASLKI